MNGNSLSTDFQSIRDTKMPIKSEYIDIYTRIQKGRMIIDSLLGRKYISNAEIIGELCWEQSGELKILVGCKSSKKDSVQTQLQSIYGEIFTFCDDQDFDSTLLKLTSSSIHYSALCERAQRIGFLLTHTGLYNSEGKLLSSNIYGIYNQLSLPYHPAIFREILPVTNILTITPNTFNILWGVKTVLSGTFITHQQISTFCKNNGIKKIIVSEQKLKPSYWDTHIKLCQSYSSDTFQLIPALDIPYNNLDYTQIIQLAKKFPIIIGCLNSNADNNQLEKVLSDPLVLIIDIPLNSKIDFTKVVWNNKYKHKVIRISINPSEKNMLNIEKIKNILQLRMPIGFACSGQFISDLNLTKTIIINLLQKIDASSANANTLENQFVNSLLSLKII